MNLPTLFGTDPPPNPQPIRGGERVSTAKARTMAGWLGQPLVTVAGVPVPEYLIDRGIVLQGSQGCGKSLTILQNLVRVLHAMAQPGSRQKLFVTDIKGDLTAAVLGLVRVICPHVPVHLVNPFDRFSSAPDPTDFDSEPTAITQLIHALSFRKRDARTDDFFDSSARAHLITLVKILKARAAGLWTWRTLLLLATCQDKLARVLKNSRAGRPKATKIVRKTFAGIVTTIEAWLDQYESAFACWDKAPVFSIEKFLRGRGVVLLTVPEDQAESLGPIARLLVRKMKDRLLTDTALDGPGKTTLVFDEYADLPGIAETIAPFFNRSRASRVSVWTAWQSWPMVCAAHGELPMQALVDNAAVRVFFACGPVSAERASKFCLGAEVRRWDESHAFGREYTRTVSSRTELRPHVLPGEFLLPLPRPGDLRVRGFMSGGHLPGPVYFEDDYGPFLEFLNRVPGVKAYRPRPVADRWLEPWDDATDGGVLNELFRKEKKK